MRNKKVVILKSSHKKTLYNMRELIIDKQVEYEIVNFGEKNPIKSFITRVNENEYKINFPSHLIW